MDTAKTVQFDQYKSLFRFQSQRVYFTETTELGFDTSIVDLITKLNEVFIGNFRFKTSGLYLVIDNRDSGTTISSYPIFSIGVGTGVDYDKKILDSTDMASLGTGIEETFVEIPFLKNMLDEQKELTFKVETAGEADDQWTGYFVLEGSLINLNL
jgi:hypothetical protein